MARWRRAAPPRQGGAGSVAARITRCSAAATSSLVGALVLAVREHDQRGALERPQVHVRPHSLHEPAVRPHLRAAVPLAVRRVAAPPREPAAEALGQELGARGRPEQRARLRGQREEVLCEVARGRAQRRRRVLCHAVVVPRRRWRGEGARRARLGQREGAARHAQRREDALLGQLPERPAGGSLEHPAGQSEAGVGVVVGGRAWGRRGTPQPRGERVPAGQQPRAHVRVERGLAVGVLSPPPSWKERALVVAQSRPVLQQVPNRQLRALEVWAANGLRDVLATVGINVEFAALARLQARNGGERLAYGRGEKHSLVH